VSWALEGYVNDYGIANMAAALAKAPSTPNNQRARLREESDYFRQRAQNYVNMFDPATKFFQGRKANGDFAAADPTVWGGAFTETDGWNFAFTAPHDGRGLADLYGGRAGLEKKLDAFFATPENADKPGSYGGVIHEMREAAAVRLGQLGMSNQPSHHIPYMYDYVGAPAKTAKLVREIMQRLYVGSEIGQGYPGDEDNGEMSSWFVLSSLGIYPLQAGSPNWAVGSPLFRKVTVHRSTGDIVVNAPNNSASNIYVQGLRVNGHAQTSVSVDSASLAHGGTLDFTMGATPSSWGTRPGDAPPSLTTGSTPPKPLQDTTGPGLGTATGPDGTDAAKLFDDASPTQVTFASGTPQITWKYNGGKQRPTFYTITSGAAPGDPADWTLLGSNDGNKWTKLDSRSGETFQWRDQTRPFAVSRSGSFTYFRLSVTRTVGASRLNLAELELLSGGDVVIGGGPLTVTAATPLDGVAGGPVSGSLATVTGGVGKAPADYSATVDWGDGTAPSAATMGNSSRGVYAVTGTHTYSKAGYYQVGVTVSDGPSQGVATGAVNVVFAPSNGLTASFDSICIGDDGTAGANCDAGGWSYSRAALSAAGLVPGQQASVPGTSLHFTPPVVAALHPDNVTGDGKTVQLTVPDDATHISFIGVGTNGEQQGTATVTFTDGTSATTPIEYGDWTFGGDPNGTPSFGNIVVARSGYRLKDGGHDPNVTFLFATAPFAVPAGEHVASVTMPSDNSDIHVFAVADDGTPPAPLTLTKPADQTATAGDTVTADLGQVSGGVGPYQARVQWGDGTVTEDAEVADPGAITGSHTYAQPGSYTVHVTAADTLGSAGSSFTITVKHPPYHPTITLGPAGGVQQGGIVSITGSGFAAGEQVTIKLGTQPTVTGTATASSTGGFTATLHVSLLASPDLYSVTATGADSVVPATATIEVLPKPGPPTYHPHIVVSPTAGPRGTAVTVTGDSFGLNELITLRLGTGSGAASTSAHSDAHGVLTSARPAVASNAPIGVTSVSAFGARSASTVSAPFEVTAGPVQVHVYRPQLDLVPAGAGVTVAGHGFAPNEQVAVGIDGRRSVTAQADSSGKVGGVQVTSAGDGGHSVSAAGTQSLDPTTASFVVLNGRAYTSHLPAAGPGGPQRPRSPGTPPSSTPPSSAPPSGPGSPGVPPPSHAARPVSGLGLLPWWAIALAAGLMVAGVLWWGHRRPTP
jgi:hypothetical protein